MTPLALPFGFGPREPFPVTPELITQLDARSAVTLARVHAPDETRFLLVVHLRGQRRRRRVVVRRCRRGTVTLAHIPVPAQARALVALRESEGRLRLLSHFGVVHALPHLKRGRTVLVGDLPADCAIRGHALIWTCHRPPGLRG